ncbi:MAG: hypothetical protein E6I88_14815 [Chloroflexi bacterium]|nr:MAG: hypothetical protein E6I88_14815 [Chloroflexota bacterium]
MTRDRINRKRNRLAAALSGSGDLLRGSLLQRTTFHSSGCPKCARGEGHSQWVLNVNYPGAKNRQLSLRPQQVPQVRKALRRYHQAKEILEAISELTQGLLRLDRDESMERQA